MPKRYQKRKKDVFIPKREVHFKDSKGKIYTIDLNIPNNWLDPNSEQASVPSPIVIVPDSDALQQIQGRSLNQIGLNCF